MRAFLLLKIVCLAQRKQNASPCICFFPACQIKDLSAPLTLINSLAASQRRLTTVAGANSTFTPFTLYLFLSRLSNQRFVRFAHASVRSLTAPQRRLTTVTAKAHRFRLHPVFVSLVPSLHKTFFGFIPFRINLTFSAVCQYFAKRLLRA